MNPEIPGVVRFERDVHGLGRFAVTNAQATAEIYLLGGQVTAFRPAGQEPVLWLSPLSPFETGKAIRGGVPICWPWFGPHPTRADLPAHGLARTREWQAGDARQLSDGRTRLRLSLADDEQTRAAWPHAFSLVLTVTVGAVLELELTTINKGETPLSFMDALHTYLSVGDARRAWVEGLDGVPFVHSTKKNRGAQTGPVTFTAGEVNHIFVPNRSEVVVIDEVMGRRIEVTKRGSLATVVWNPGESGAAGMKDVHSHWTEFVCVEAANCAGGDVVLAPGEAHTTAQTLRVTND